MNEPPALTPRTILASIIAALVLWGIYVAAGVLWYGLNPLGAVLVLFFVGTFLGFWLLLLHSRNRRQP